MNNYFSIYVDRKIDRKIVEYCFKGHIFVQEVYFTLGNNNALFQKFEIIKRMRLMGGFVQSVNKKFYVKGQYRASRHRMQQL